MNKACFVLALSVAMFLCGPDGLGSVGGGTDGGIGGTFNPCGSGGVLYRNLTLHRINFELVLSVAGCGSTSLSWTDAQGHPQTLTVNQSNNGTIVATSLPVGGTISWSSPPAAGSVVFGWAIQRGQAASLGSGLLFPCGTSGTFYANLTNRALEVDFAVNNTATCQFTFSWTDPSGRLHTLTPGPASSEGVTTALPAGGVISWVSASGNGGGGGQIELAPPREGDNPESPAARNEATTKH